MSEARIKLKPGDTVRVVRARGTAKIRAIPTSMHGALLDSIGLYIAADRTDSE
jgi:hypothetical protein